MPPFPIIPNTSITIIDNHSVPWFIITFVLGVLIGGGLYHVVRMHLATKKMHKEIVGARKAATPSAARDALERMR